MPKAKLPDPTKAAIQHVDTEVKRLNDLSLAEKEFTRGQISHLKEIQQLTLSHDREFRELIMRNAENEIKNKDAAAAQMALLFESFKKEVAAAMLALQTNQAATSGRMSTTQIAITIALMVAAILATWFAKK
jgi:hypothetical protein